jgi:hypothetical protein
MSEEAEAVLSRMLSGWVLVGAESDFGRPFRLEHDGTWDNVSFSVAQEVLESGRVVAGADRGNSQREYRPAIA